MMQRERFFTKPILVVFLVLVITRSIGFAGEATIEEAGLIFDLPEAWTQKTEKTKIPTGQLVQVWGRAPMKLKEGSARPGIIALATPVPKDANLVMLTQARLLGEPFQMNLSDAECMKGVRYTTQLPQGTVQAISFEPPPGCQEGLTEGAAAPPCHFEKIKQINVPLEASWAFRIEKEMPFGAMKILLIHALVDGKLVEISVSYPAELAESVEAEIAPIISSLRKP